MGPRALLATFAIALTGCGTTVASIQFVEVSPPHPKIGDVVTIRFKVLDDRGLSADGATVNFSLSTAKAGVTLSPLSAAVQRGSGTAETQLVVSSRVNSVIVKAQSGGKELLSPSITFAGSVPNARSFTFQCGPTSGEGSGGRHAIGAYDETRNLIAGVRLDCTAHLADRNSEGVADALVSFMAEAGTIGATETTKTDLIGNATVLYKTSYPLPQDVEPTTWSWTPLSDPSHTGEYVAPLWMEPFLWVPNPMVVPRPLPASNPIEPARSDPERRKPDGSGPYKNNPRDNLVTLVAITSGEEGFSDLNNNGVWDQGEPFEDTTEPFIDMNDNGTWDGDPNCNPVTSRLACGEPFIDVNGNKGWDGKNDKWDSDTLIWTTERILWTGLPGYLDMHGSPEPILVPLTGNVALICPTGAASCAQAGPPALVTAVLSDPWYNTIAQNADNDGCLVQVEEQSPIKVSPNVVNKGTKFIYPAADIIQFFVRDARDPLADAAAQVPKRTPPLPFSVPMTCQFTSSPKDGLTAILNIGTVSGTTE